MRTISETGIVVELRRLKEKHSDLIAVVASNFALLIVASTLTTAEPIRVVLALSVALFFPGYALLAALLPKNTDLEPLERLALSIGLSIFLLTAIAFLLNATHIGIRTFPIILSLTACSLVCVAFAYRRRSSISPEEHLTTQFPTWTLMGRRLGPFGQKATAGLAFVIVIAVLYTILIIRPFGNDHLTQFYLLDQYGSPENLPLNIEEGMEVDVILGIGNREGRPVEYRVELWIQGDFQRTIDDRVVPDREIAQFPVRFAPSNVEGLQRIEFRLFRQEDSEPYRSLHLWLE